MVKSDCTGLVTRSSSLILVQCDCCHLEKWIKFSSYCRGGFKDDEWICRGCKTKKTNLERWGVENPSQNDLVKEKKKRSFIEKWGVDHPSKSDIIIEKKKKVFIEKWGVENPFQSEEIKEVIKLTNLSKLGVENPSQSDLVKEKKKEAFIEKWGVDHPLKSDEIKDRIIKSNLKKWGDSSHTKSEIFRKDRFKITREENYIEYISDRKSRYFCKKGHYFEIESGTYSDRNRYNIPICTICNPIGDLKSIKENDLYSFIHSIYDGEIIQSWRSGLEIDIYLPDLKLGFEFNGLYWHSDKYKDKWYHINKTKHFGDLGIRVIHIWEDDWVCRKDIVKSQISNILNKTANRIFARKCDVVVLSSVSEFLNSNHIQGVDYSKVKLGLIFEGELVSVMTFNKLEGRKSMGDGDWNLSRFCNKINTNVIGGASKLLNYFIKNWVVSRVISYADRDWSLGGLYENLGFMKVSESRPDYKYLVGGVRVHKSKYKKSVTGISESKLDIPKIWDCGKLKFEKLF
jgi:hypothetical protein